MMAVMPGLHRMMGDFKVGTPIRIRPADLCVTDGYLRPGVVLAGDAFSTSCPAAGTGTTKVFTDVERLCNIHIPAWLATDGMDVDKIKQFYEDPIKVACEARCLAKAYHLRSLSIERGVAWRAGRWGRFAVRLAQGVRYAIRKRLPVRSARPGRRVIGGQPPRGRLA